MADPAKAQVPTPDVAPPPRIVVITDVGHDYDDIMAIIELAHLHNQGRIILVGIIATLAPELERAKIALHTIRDVMKISGVSVAKGSNGLPEGSPKKPELKDYEMMPGAQNIKAEEIESDFLEFASKIFQEAADTGEKIHLLSIGGHKDVHAILKSHKEILASAVSAVHIQGGCIVEADKIKRDPDAANNNYDADASQAMYEFLTEQKDVKTRVYTREATFKSTFDQKVFDGPSKLGDLVAYLKKAHYGTIKNFFHTSIDPQWPHQDKNREWLVRTRLRKDTPEKFKKLLLDGAKRDPKPGVDDWATIGDEVMGYSVVTSNDGLAALGCAGIVPSDVLNAQQVGKWDHITQVGEQINGEKMSELLYEALANALAA